MKIEKIEDVIKFSIESRLLQELGERLVSEPNVAVAELIKNAYDADSPTCELEYSENRYLKVIDAGHGMTFDAFKTKWMSIATSNKVNEAFSPKYGRFLTGAKGVGRFAVRSLGKHLELETVSIDPDLDVRTRITASFDWLKLDRTTDLFNLKVPYKYEYPVTDPVGTTLTITKLKQNLDDNAFKKIRTNVLEIASPISALRPEEGFFKKSIRKKTKNSIDPGFEITINDSGGENEGPAETILNNYVGRAVAKLDGNNLELIIKFTNHSIIKKKYKYKSAVGSNIYADIRYFPKRLGAFRDIGVDGRSAWSWVRDNHGVKVYDKGFQVTPYGGYDDDWLMLDADNAHSEREWRSPLSRKYIPIPTQSKGDPYLNPMVNMVTNYQTIGAVFIESSQNKNEDETLIPSMDRQGFVNNTALQNLKDITRFAIEYMRNIDKAIQLIDDEEERLEKHQAIESNLKEVIKEIEQSPTLSRKDKIRLVDQFEYISKDVKDAEAYDRRAREGLDMMGFLGVVAGFMTHEHESILWELESVTELLEKHAKKDKKFLEVSEKVQKNIANISGYVDYTKLFIKNINSPIKNDIKAKPRIRHAIKTFSKFATDREYKIDLEVSSGELMPCLPIPLYEGVVLNLYTNALKALVAASHITEPSILICAWSDSKYRYVSVSDNGVGVPEKVKDRIWDPLFTTTSGEQNPLGSGMGLGLSLIKKVIKNLSGSISLVNPPPGYKTSFKVQFPRRNSYGQN